VRADGYRRLIRAGLAAHAHRLFLSEHTVRRHLADILRKLNLSSRAAAAAWGVRTGLGMSLPRSGHLPRPGDVGPYALRRDN